MPSRTLSEAEYNAVKQRVLDSLPSGLSEEQYKFRVSSAMAGAIAEAENSAPIPEGSTVGRAAAGAWKNLNPIAAAEGLYSAVRHPIDTASAIGRSQLDQLAKAVEDAKAGRYSEMVGHGTAAALPILGPAAANAGERIATGDVAGGVGEGVGLLTPFVAKPVLRGATAATRGAVNVVRSTDAGANALNAVAAMADRASTNRIVDVAAPKVGPKKVALTNQMAEIAPKLARAEDLSALSREGWAVKMASKLEDARAALDDATDARLASQQVTTTPILAKLDEQIAKLTAQPVDASRPIPSATATGPQARPMGLPVEPAPMAAQIDTLRKIRSEVAQLGPVAPYESIRRIRAAWDEVAKSKFLSSTAEDAVKSKGAATGAVKGTGALRDGLSSADPGTAAANADFSLYKTANDVLQATIESDRARPRVLRGVLSRAGGAMAGAEAGGVAGAGMGALLGAFVERATDLAPTLKIVMARKLASIADLLRSDPAAAQAALRKATASLPAKAKSVASRVAAPLGNVVDFPGLPRAADNQDSTAPTIGQR